MIKGLGKKRNAQITFYIAFLLFIFLLVGLFLFQFSKLFEEKDDIFVSVPIDSFSVMNMVEICFSSATDKALLLAARTGGNIHDPSLDFNVETNDGKYGEKVVPFLLNNNYSFTGYGVRISSSGGNNQGQLPGPPFYPYSGYLISNPSVPNNYFPFNYNNYQNSIFNPYSIYLKSLCDLHGLNKPIQNFFLHSCLTYSSIQNSIQNIMEEYAKRYVINCTRNLIQTSYGHTNINLENALVTSNIGETDVVFYLNYPINVGGIIEQYDFSSRKKARLKHAYEIAAMMIRNDSINIFFDMVNETQLNTLTFKRHDTTSEVFELEHFMYGFDFERIKNACPITNYEFSDIICGPQSKWNFSDVILITDQMSSIAGEPLVFSFAVENRPPALDWIRTPTGDSLSDYYDIVTFSGGILRIEPEAYDPDRDAHPSLVNCRHGSCMRERYEYFGWKADYDEIFQFILDDNNKPTLNVTGIINTTSDGIENVNLGNINLSEPVDNGIQILPVFRNLTGGVSCWRGDNLDSIHGGGVCLEGLNLWHNSTQFQATKRIATYRTKLEDAGAHTVRVIVYDRQGLFDYQDIRILIKPLLGGGLNPYTQYGLLPEHASWEDPYTIMVYSPLNQEYFDHQFVWNDTCSNVILGDGTIDNDNAFAKIEFNKDINDPSGFFNFSNELSSGLSNCDHQNRLNLSLYDEGVLEIYFTFPLNLTQCLPVRINNSIPYPFFAGLDEDPFLTTHACCSNETDTWGTYEPEGEVCYTYNKRYSFYDLNRTYTYNSGAFDQQIFPANISLTEYENEDYPNELIRNYGVKLILNDGPYEFDRNSRNDIIDRTFTQYCSGNRGNACSGDATDFGTVIRCNNLISSNGEIASCHWPCGPRNPYCNKDEVADADINLCQSNMPLLNDFPQISYENQLPKQEYVKTFERHFLNEVGQGENTQFFNDGLCNPIKKCSSTYYWYNDGGNFLNQGICGSNGNCNAGWMFENCAEQDPYFYDSSLDYNNYYYRGPKCISNGDLPDEDECGFDDEKIDLDSNENYCKDAADSEENPLSCDGSHCWVPNYERNNQFQVGNYSLPPPNYANNLLNDFGCCGDDENLEQFSSNINRFSGVLMRGCCAPGRTINKDGFCASETCLIKNVYVEGCDEDNPCTEGDSIIVTFEVEGCNNGNYYLQLHGFGNNCIISYNSFENPNIKGLRGTGSNLGGEIIFTDVFSSTEGYNTCYQGVTKITDFEAWIFTDGHNQNPISKLPKDEINIEIFLSN